jgi:hypothetical protein
MVFSFQDDMIYLREKQLLFLKPRKTAGTSVEIALSCNANADDIVTPITFNDELIRIEKGGQFPVNWATKEIEDVYRTRTLAYAKSGADSSFRLYSLKEAKFFNHISPAKIVEITGADFLENAFIVTMCRHPYEQLISQVYFKFRNNNDADFNETIYEILGRGSPNKCYYFYDGKFLPDFVIRYEHLLDDLRDLEQRFQLSLVDNLPRTKYQYRKNRRPAREILTEEQKKICYQHNLEIFEQFGYEK